MLTENKMSSENDIALLSAFSLLSLTDFVGNTLVCSIILQWKRFRFRRSALDFLFLNLAIADMMVAVFAIPRYVLHGVFVHPRGLVGDYLCRYITGGNLMWTAGSASVFTLVTIAFERRHVADVVLGPYGFTKDFSQSKLLAFVIMSWIFALLLNLPLFFIMSYDEEMDFCTENWPHPVLPKLYGVLWFTVVGALPILCMTILYSKVVYQLWVRKVRTQQVNHRARLIPRRKATRMAITLTVIYSVCWLPNLILYILAFNHSNFVYGSPLYKWSVVLTCLNSAVNPFVYTLQSRRFRTSVKRTIMCK